MLLIASILIPIITLTFLLIFFRKALVWQEVILLLITAPILTLIFNLCAEKALTHDTEYWGGYTQQATYEEDWDEYIHRTCTRTVSCGKDCTTVETYDCSYVDYHPETWWISGSNGESIYIPKSRFDLLCNQFGNKTFKDMNRHYYTNDGDAYFTVWDKKEETLDTITTKHSWENRVQASGSVFKFQEVDPKKFGLYEYPNIVNDYKQQSYMGPDMVGVSTGVKRLDYWNAILGAKKRVRIYVMIYKNKPMEAAFEQENYWKGGNKNELNICVGLNDTNQVQWAHTFSWTPKEILKVEVNNFVLSKSTFNLTDLAEYVGPAVQQKWVKKNFREFDYLSVEPPQWVVYVGLTISLLVSIIIAIVSVNNRFTNANPKGY